jgi:predicted ester cyclase
MAGPRTRNKAIVRRLFNEGWNGDLNVFDQVIAEDFLVHFAAHGGEVLGIGGAKEMVADFQEALHGLQCTIEDLVAERDRVAARVTYSGEGRSLSRIVILRLAEDRVAEAWEG